MNAWMTAAPAALVMLMVGGGFATTAAGAGEVGVPAPAPTVVKVSPSPASVGKPVTITDPVPTADRCATAGEFAAEVRLTIRRPNGSTVLVADTPTAGQADWSITYVPTQLGTYTVTGNCFSETAECPPEFCGGYTGSFRARDATRPTVRITKLVVHHRMRMANVRFTGRDNSTAASAMRFRCRVDARPKARCSSPKAFRNLKPGRHVVRVWSIDRAGNVSLPAVQRFRMRR